MASVNRASRRNQSLKKTHEGAIGSQNATNIQQLERTLMSCMLWEKTFYEDGETIADRLKEEVFHVSAEVAVNTAVRARNEMKLRHAPLLVMREVLRHPYRNQFPAKMVENGIVGVCKRVDDMTELLAMYLHSDEGKQPVAHVLKRGLARALCSFDEYQLAKYDRKGAVTLRDMLRIVRPKPKDKEQEALWGRVVKGELKIPDTWETRLSSGEDKKAVFEDLLKRGRLGDLALLRNLRNMEVANVDRDLVKSSIAKSSFPRVLPFRFVAASLAAPVFEAELSAAIIRGAEKLPKLAGTTHVLIDNSGSMGSTHLGFVHSPTGQRSEMTNIYKALGLGIYAANICEEPRLWLFSNYCVEIPPRKDLSLIDVQRKHNMGGTHLGAAIKTVSIKANVGDRLIVISDEQSHDVVGEGLGKFGATYMVNLANYKTGVSYGKGWTAHMDGFSERVIEYIAALEASKDA